MRAGLNAHPRDPLDPLQPPQRLRMRLGAWLWGAIEIGALWRARWRLRGTPVAKRA